MKLTNTRKKNKQKAQKVSLSKAILNPSAKYGGLFAPKKLPTFAPEFFEKATQMSYQELAMSVIKSFKFDISDNIFQAALKRYESFDTPNEPAVFKRLAKNLYINELWHGPTRAFKDMALQPFGAILSALAKEKKQKFLIACATSGDTGPATLASFENSKDVRVLCLYPEGGTSAVQHLQMATMQAKNLKSIAINGDFDTAQSTLKALLADKELKAQIKSLGLSLSAANSVNFGRILFQIIYHIYAYVRLLESGALRGDESFDIIVPSGNFGNALGAYYAKKMGARIDKIKIVSNANNILSELFNTGIYDLRERKLVKTISPAMDILISSNIERLLFDKFGAKRTKELMDSLSKNRYYQLSQDELSALRQDFEADYCSDKKCKKFIKKWAKKGVLLDPHTATCLKMRDKSKLSVITSTAEWVKFAPSMAAAIDEKLAGLSEIEQIKALAQIEKTSADERILKLFQKEIVHTKRLDANQIRAEILEWIK